MIRTDSLRRTRDRARRSSRQRQRLSRWMIQRPGEGNGSHDGDGNWTPPEPTTIYEGHAFLEGETARSVRARADGALVTADPVLVVPHDAGPFKVGDVCTPLDAPPSLMGRTWRVSGPSGDSYDVDQGLRVQEVTDA